MKKILLFTDSLGAGGAQRQLCGLAIMLKQNGYDVTVVTYFKHDFYKGYLDENCIKNVVVAGKGVIGRIFSIRRFFNKERPDWVIAYQETPSLISALIRFTGLKFKLIVSERNTTQYVSIKDKLRFYLYHTATAIVPNSYSQENFLSLNYRWMKNKLQTITNFVDFDTFTYDKHKRSEIPLIVVVASIWPPKNTLGFIDAMKILSDRGIAYKVKWYGYSKAHQAYYNQANLKIQEYGLSHCIDLLHKTTYIKDVYVEADYFCLPSFYEGVPNVIAEAMATGRPIICSNVCDNSRYVNESNGFLFDPRFPENIANQIEKAISLSEDDYAEMCVNSRKRAESLLSKSVFIKKYIDILAKC